MNFQSPEGHRITPKESIVYLGSAIAIDGRIDSELARRLGMAQGDFNALNQVWRHTSLSKYEKYDIFMTIVVNRLLYGLQVTWLGKVALRRVDAFHARCA